MTKATFQDLMVQLTDKRTPRVWSLLVTVFGELAQDEGAQIKGSVLTKLTSLMGIKPEAMRVALHRLRKDGWIKSERNGRTSAYSLTDWGRAQSALATPRIYDLEPVPEQAWLVIFDPNQPVRNTEIDGIWVASNIAMTATPPDDTTGYVSSISTDQTIPHWMLNKICPPEFVRLTQGFHERLVDLQTALKTVDALDCFEVSAMRILIVDGWRRIALKTPLLPPHVFPDTWMGQSCRIRVAALLGAYSRQDLDVLEAGV